MFINFYRNVSFNNPPFILNIFNHFKKKMLTNIAENFTKPRKMGLYGTLRMETTSKFGIFPNQLSSEVFSEP